MAGKILVVDDDKDLRKAMGIRLKASGYDVIFAGDGYSATKMIREEKPDLIILDLGLPAGDGFTVMQRSNNFEIDTPIIVYSARDEKINRKRALEAGATAYFQKPAENDELLAAIIDALA